MERRVSDYLRQSPLPLGRRPRRTGPLERPDVSGTERHRPLSNYGKALINPRSDEWLGNDSPNKKIRQSGLWNVDHVDESYDPAFLDHLAGASEANEPPSRASEVIS